MHNWWLWLIALAGMSLISRWLWRRTRPKTSSVLTEADVLIAIARESLK
jgi:hypothetical protein